MKVDKKKIEKDVLSEMGIDPNIRNFGSKPNLLIASKKQKEFIESFIKDKQNDK